MKTTVQKGENIMVGLSIEEYFSKINHVIQTNTNDIEGLEDNCGSWHERES